MQEITIQKWIEFYRGDKSITKFISLLKKEDLFLLSYTPENLVIEENLPELGILEEDFKNILYEDVRLQNKLLFVAEEKDLYDDINKMNRNIKGKALNKLNESKERKESLIYFIWDKVVALKEKTLSEDEKNHEIKKQEITSSKNLLLLEKELTEELLKEKQEFKNNLENKKEEFLKEILNCKTRLVIALYHGVDHSYWQERYGQEFKDVIWSSVVQGEYEIYGYEYPKVMKKLVERKIVSAKDLIDYSIPRGMLESERYPVNTPSFNLIQIKDESAEDFKKRKKEKQKEMYNRELKKNITRLNRQIIFNKIKIFFGI